MGGQTYADRVMAARQAALDIGQEMGLQKMWDYLQLVMSNPEVMGKDTFGRKRFEKIYKALQKEADYWHIAFTKDPEADCYQEKLDEQLRKIWEDDFQTFEERYPYIKQPEYGRKRR